MVDRLLAVFFEFLGDLFTAVDPLGLFPYLPDQFQQFLIFEVAHTGMPLPPGIVTAP